MNKRIVYSVVFILIFTVVVSFSVAAKVVFGVLPDDSILPLLVAEEEGIFKGLGVDVELVLFNTALERDSALQSEKIDGTISDVLGAAFAVDNGQRVQITSSAKGRFTLLAAPDSNINTYKELENVPVAVSFNTIIEYLTDKLFEVNGISGEKVEKIAINKIPVRLQMLIAGQVRAALLPEPLGSLAIKEGARVIGTTEELAAGPSVILYTEQAINNKGKEIEKFYQAYSQAVVISNQDPENYRDLLVEKARFPVNIIDAFEFMEYEKPQLPEDRVLAEALSWLYERELLNNELDYEDLVTDRFFNKKNEQ